MVLISARMLPVPVILRIIVLINYVKGIYHKLVVIKHMLSSRYKLLFIKRMCLIVMAFYEPDLDWLESMWSLEK